MHLKQEGIKMSDVPLWFECDEFITDCYWFELLYHLFKTLQELLKRLIQNEDMDATLQLVSQAIGCYAFLQRDGINFVDTDVETIYTSLHKLVYDVRQHALYRMCYQELDEGRWRTAVAYGNAFLEGCKKQSFHNAALIACDELSNVVHSESVDALKLDVLRAWSKCFWCTSNSVDAIRVLLLDSRLEADANKLAKLLSNITPDVLQKAKERKTRLEPINFSKQLFQQGEHPLDAHELHALFPTVVAAPPPPPPVTPHLVTVRKPVKHKSVTTTRNTRGVRRNTKKQEVPVVQLDSKSESSRREDDQHSEVENEETEAQNLENVSQNQDVESGTSETSQSKSENIAASDEVSSIHEKVVEEPPPRTMLFS